MTKKILSFLIAATLLLGVCVTAFAADEDVVFSTMVVDIPDVLDETEETQLNDRAWEITQKYGCAVYILISDTLEGYEAWEYNAVSRLWRRKKRGDPAAFHAGAGI